MLTILYLSLALISTLILYKFGKIFNSKKIGSLTAGKVLPVVSARGILKRLVSRLLNGSEYEGKYIQDVFISLYKDTGHPMYCIDFLLFKLIVSNDYDTNKEILLSESCSDRVVDKSVLLRTFNGQPQGIISNNGEGLKEIRRYTVKTLGQMGFSSKTRGITEIVQDTLPELLQHIDSMLTKTGNRIPVKDLFALSVINIVWSIAGGNPFSRDDTKVATMLQLNNEISELTHLDLIILNILVPFIRRYPSVFKYDKPFKAMKVHRKYFAELVRERSELGNYKEDAKDFIDSFLQEIDKHKNDPKYCEIYSLEQLVMVLVDLFTAGKDTTSNSLEAAFMFMVQYPEIQRKIQAEIDTVVGRDRQPSYMEDRSKMPYTMAALLEINRMVTVSPLAPRSAGSDGLINGYHIPKGSWIIVNLFAMHMDTEFWGDPTVFRPERFLDAQKDFIRSQVSRSMPFGGGPRVCIGESAANVTLFTYFTGVLQRYHVQKVDASEKLGLLYSLTTNALPYHISLSLR